MHFRLPSESASHDVFNSFKTFQFPVSHLRFYLLEDILQDLLADCVVTPGEVVGGVLLARDHVTRPVERLVRTGLDLTRN